MQPETAWLLERYGVGAEEVTVSLRERRHLSRRGTTSVQAMPQQMTAWDTLYRTLRDRLGDACYRQDSRLIDIAQTPDAVEASFADGYRARADLLIAADGVGSASRRALWPEDPGASYSGYVAWRGLEEEAALPHELVDELEDRFTILSEDHTQLLCYLVPGANGATKPGSRRVNWVWYRNTPADDLTDLLTGRSGTHFSGFLPPGELTETNLDQLRADARRLLPPPLARLVEASRPFMQPVQDLAAGQMVLGRALIIGDAAGTVRPHTASGTSKAFADAILLSTALEGWSSGRPLPVQLLEQWEQHRHRAAANLRQIGLRSAASSGLGGPTAVPPMTA